MSGTRYLFPAFIVCLLLSDTALGAELKPLPLLDQGFDGCPDKPAPKTRSVHLIVRDSVRHDVGPYSVQLPGYSTDSQPDSYVPMRIEACRGDTMRIDLENGLTSTSDEPDTNLHTHGLIVHPTPDRPGPPGDYVFVNIQPGHTERYSITIPPDLPGTVFGKSRAPQPYPSGLYWFHAHRHMFAHDQVQAGEAGILSIGNPLEIAFHDNEGKAVVQDLPPNTQTSYLALRDIQLAVPVGSRPNSANGQTAEWLNGLGNRPDYNSGACSDPTAWHENGACGSSGLTVNGQARDLAWLFTVNGQLFPKISYSADRPQLWRIANLSSNVTYLLEIAAGDTPASDAPTRQFFALTLDGIVAGAPSESEPGALLGVRLRRLLLMPGARAEIYLPPDECGDVATLRTVGIQTGPNPPAAPTGDPWPAVNLARVEATYRGSCNQSKAYGQAPVRRPAELNFQIPPRDAALSRPMPGANAPAMLSQSRPETPDAIIASLSKLHPSCVFLSAPTGSVSHRRRIVFEEDNSNSIFKLGSDVVDASGKPMNGTHIEADRFPDPLNWKTTKHVCPVLGAQEVWELVNNTDEMHNFHIHQSKFRLADSSLDEGVPDGLRAVVSTDKNCNQEPAKAAFCDPLGVIGGNVPDAGGAMPNQADLWHDTIPVPPRSTEGHPGRVFVSIPFKAPEQEGRLVFHCHILEHEDGGMMAPVEVLNAASIARQQEDEPMPAMTMPHKHADLWRRGPASLFGWLGKAPASSVNLEQALTASMCASSLPDVTAGLSKSGPKAR